MSAKLIYKNQEVYVGYCVLVENTARKFGENSRYVCVKMKAVGSSSQSYMFTEHELEKCPLIDLSKECFDPRDGELYPFTFGNLEGYLVTLYTWANNVKRQVKHTCFITQRKLDLAKKRDDKNPEDRTVLGFWSNVKDTVFK